MVQVLQIKLGHWQNLPHILIGMAHFDPSIARECGRQALAKAQSSLAHPGVHRLTQLVCTPGLALVLFLLVDNGLLT